MEPISHARDQLFGFAAQLATEGVADATDVGVDTLQIVGVQRDDRGTRVDVAVGDGMAPATVETLPIYDPQKRRPRS